MTKMEIVDTTAVEFMTRITRIIEKSILTDVIKIVNEDVLIIPKYRIHDLGFTQIADNVTEVLKIDRRCDAIKDVEGSTPGSDNKKEAQES